MLRKTKTVGVLGGMGPYATLTFYHMLLEMTPVTKDWDHLRVILDINPHIPSRSRHYAYGEPSPVPAMIDSCARLKAYPVDFIVIPCNSASYFLADVQAAVQIPILNIMQITVEELTRQFPNVRTVGVLGSVITWDRRTYEPFLKHHGLTYVQHTASVQRKIEYLIEQIKINTSQDDVVKEFHKLLQSFQKDLCVEAVLLGCTEFACLGSVKANIPVVDSSRELARATVRLAIS